MIQDSPAGHEDYFRAGVPDRGCGSCFGKGVLIVGFLEFKFGSAGLPQSFTVFTAGVLGASGFLAGHLVYLDRDEWLKKPGLNLEFSHRTSKAVQDLHHCHPL